MNNLSVGKRLYLLVGLLAGLALLLTFVGLKGMSSTVAGLKTVYEDRTAPLVQLGDIRRLHAANVADLLRGIQHDPKNEVAKLHDHPTEEHTKRINGHLAEIDKLWAAYLATYLTPEEKQLAKDFDAKYKRYIAEIILPTVKALEAGNFSLEVISRFLKANRTLAKDADDALDALTRLQEREAKSEFDKAQSGFDTSRLVSIVLALAGIGGALAFAAMIIRSIVAPLRKMQEVITAASQQGDFTQHVEARSNDEVGQTARAFGELMQTLRTTFSGLRNDVGSLDHAANSLVDSAGQAAASTAQASDAASSMAASVEELSVTVSHIADRARDASSTSEHSGELSAEGSRIIQATAEEIKNVATTVRNGASAIAELGEQSERISGIVSVIKDVADQTNLLALNAAIEAARAGEQGRGFAVVADEVRKLAERTTSATVEISAMIGAIQQGAQASVEAMNQAVERVEAGVGMAQRAESAIGDIRNESDQVVHAVNEISNALAEQSAASTSLAQQVERVAQATEENSAAAANTDDAARNLGQLANSMLGTMSKFKV